MYLQRLVWIIRISILERIRRPDPRLRDSVRIELSAAPAIAGVADEIDDRVAVFGACADDSDVGDVGGMAGGVMVSKTAPI